MGNANGTKLNKDSSKSSVFDDQTKEEKTNIVTLTSVSGGNNAATTEDKNHSSSAPKSDEKTTKPNVQQKPTETKLIVEDEEDIDDVKNQNDVKNHVNDMIPSLPASDKPKDPILTIITPHHRDVAPVTTTLPQDAKEDPKIELLSSSSQFKEEIIEDHINNIQLPVRSSSPVKETKTTVIHKQDSQSSSSSSSTSPLVEEKQLHSASFSTPNHQNQKLEDDKKSSAPDTITLFSSSMKIKSDVEIDDEKSAFAPQTILKWNVRISNLT